MKTWRVRTVIGCEDMENLLNQQEQEGYSLHYFTFKYENDRFIALFKHEEGEGGEPHLAANVKLGHSHPNDSDGLAGLDWVV